MSALKEPPALAGLVSRAASIEIRFSDQDRLEQALEVYAFLLNVAAPPTKEPYSFELPNNVELRLVLTNTDSDCMVVYWQWNGGTTSGDFDKEYDKVVKGGKCNGKHKPEKDKYLINGKDTWRCLFEGPSKEYALAKYLFGMIINPPFP